jgi:hypothetical protein
MTASETRHIFVPGSIFPKLFLSACQKVSRREPAALLFANFGVSFG